MRVSILSDGAERQSSPASEVSLIENDVEGNSSVDRFEDTRARHGLADARPQLDQCIGAHQEGLCSLLTIHGDQSLIIS
jgi:hypothetical protein